MSTSTNSLKTFVIDTNVLIHRPDAILSFRDNEVVIPLWVLEELDNLKSAGSEKGRNARAAVRFLDEQCKRGSLNDGVMMENGSRLRIVHSYGSDVKCELESSKIDNKILMTALSLQKEGKRVFFVSKDINARVKATALGIRAMDYEKQKVDVNTLYSGVTEMTAAPETVKALQENGFLEWNQPLLTNQFVIMRTADKTEVAVGKYQKQTNRIVYVPKHKKALWGIKPLNMEQDIALSLLLDDSIPLVTLVGKAGTGKTLLSIAAGLKKTCDEKKYTRVLVSRPIIPMGKDIGYLPGDKDTKLKSWMQPLFDNLDYIINSYKNSEFATVQALLKENIIEIEALTYIRGRSLPHQFIIIDEAQNLTPHEVKTIVSRAGEGTKVVLTGDPYQIDSPYLDCNSNGLAFLVDAFKGQELYGHITLEKSERSRLAELAAELL